MKFSKEMVQTLGEAGFKIGKRIVIEGTKAVILKGAVATIETSMDKGIDGIKGMTLDKFLGQDDESKVKKGLFKRKKKEVEEVDIDEIINDIDSNHVFKDKTEDTVVIIEVEK